MHPYRRSLSTLEWLANPPLCGAVLFLFLRQPLRRCPQRRLPRRNLLVSARELSDARLDQLLKISVPKAHSLGVGTCPNEYSLVLGQGLFYVDGQFVEVAERRHRSDLAVRKGVLKLLLLG